MTTTNKMDKMLTSLFRPAVEYSWINKDYWKVIFVENKAYIASGYHILELSNFPEDIKPQGLYYDFARNAWGNDLDFPIGMGDIHRTFDIKEKGFFDTNYNLLLQYCNSFDDAIKRESRIVIAPHHTKEDELTVSFDIEANGQRVCDKQSVRIMIAPNSQIKNEDIIPHMPYACKVEQIAGTMIYVNALAPAGIIKMGLYHTKGSFIMENAEQMEYIHGMRDLPQEFMYTAFKQVGGYVPTPIHLDTGMFIDTVKAFSISDDQYIRFGTSEDPNFPITLESLGAENHIKVRAVIATLNPFMGPQRR